MNIEVTDALLRQLSEEWLDSLEVRYPSHPARPYHFSVKFRLKMWWLCKKADWYYSHKKDMTAFDAGVNFHWTRRTAAALLAAALGATVAMACAAQYFRMVRDEYKKYSSVYYEKVAEGFVPGEFVCYTLGYVPEGFVLEQEVTFDNGFHEEMYFAGDGRSFAFDQMSIESATLDIDTEKVQPVEISLNKTQKAWFVDNSTNKVVYWDNGEYFFSVYGHLSKDELVNVANSITIK